MCVDEAAAIFARSVKWLDVGFIVLGLLRLWHPVGVPGPASLFSEERGEQLGFPRTVTERLITLAEERTAVSSPSWLAYLYAVAFIAAGAIGLATTIDEPTIVSALAVVEVLVIAATIIVERRNMPERVAFVADTRRRPARIDPALLVMGLIVMAGCETSLGSRISVTVGVATAVFAVAIVAIGTRGHVLSGNDVALESEIDRRYRLSRIVVCAIFSTLPSLVWLASQTVPWFFRTIVEAGLLAVLVFISTARSQADRELKALIARTP
jgi:hypothetical protein